MDHLKSNPYSHLTAKDRDSLSFPARYLLNKNLFIGEVLDFGCGFGKDVEILKRHDIQVTGYDKHYFPDYPKQKYDTVICFYVLNVLLPEEQATVLMELSQLVKPGGTVYIAVRRDVQIEGFRMHKIHHQKTYQCNVVLNFRSLFKNENCEIYEYSHYNRLSHPGNNTCPFCSPDAGRELIVESATAYSLFDKYPVSKGHALVIPKKHCPDYFDLTFREQSACIYMLNTVKQILQSKFNPDGFNIGLNIGADAGQTVPHVHIHVIPRYKGDVEEPRGGVRGVIPGKQKY